MDTAHDWAAIAADIAIDEYVDTARTNFADGYRPPLTVIMISNGGTEPVVDRIVVRAAYPGTDTARAITDIGNLLAARRPDTVVICWEHQSLTTARHPDATPPPEAVIIALTAGDDVAVKTFNLEPGNPQHHKESGAFTPPPMPEPVTRLLHSWRQPHCGNVQAIITDLESRGYSTCFDDEQT